MKGLHKSKGSFWDSRLSPSPSDVSELSVLSRSPSPPSMLRTRAKQTKPTVVKATTNGIGGWGARLRSLGRKRARDISPSAQLPRKKTTTSKKLIKDSKVQSRLDFKVSKPTSKPLDPKQKLACPLGTLSVIPKEIRQMIYEYSMNIAKQVCVKKCCGSDATHRERAKCKKHSCGHPDGGRFNVFLASKTIYLEACWVLRQKGSLCLAISQPLAPYFVGYSQKTRSRLNDSPRNKKVKAMWTSAAKYQVVVIQVADAQFKYEDPVTYTGRLVDTVSLLLKGWETLSSQPSMSIMRRVTVRLASIFNEIIPFNGGLYPDGAYVPVPYWLPSRYEKPSNLAAQSNMNLKKLISIIDRHRGQTEWTVTALSELSESSSEGVRNLESFKRSCYKIGLRFEGLTFKSWSSEAAETRELA